MLIKFFHDDEDPELREFILTANPHLYDYAHFIALKQNNEVEFIDGAGQLLNMQVKGNYKINVIDNLSAEITFHDLVETDPYDEKEVLGKIESITVRVKREEGLFPFIEEYPVKYDNENELPCLLYKHRYVFDSDPLSIALEKQKNNLYNILEEINSESLRYYYPLTEREKMSFKELSARGITRDQLIGR